MKNDPLKQFMSLRAALVEERSRLSERLKEIDAALKADDSGALAATVPKRKGRPLQAQARKAQSSSSGRAGGRARTRGGITLKEAALRLTREKPLTKTEIIEGAKKLGWTTTSRDPLNLLNPLLYGKKSPFKNVGGKFAPK